MKEIFLRRAKDLKVSKAMLYRYRDSPLHTHCIIILAITLIAKYITTKTQEPEIEPKVSIPLIDPDQQESKPDVPGEVYDA